MLAGSTLALVLLLAGCGGDDDSATADPDVGSPGNGDGSSTDEGSGPEGGDGSAPEAGDEGPAPSSGSNIAPMSAVVTVADQIFDFALVNCFAIGGGISGAGPSTDGGDISVDMQLQPSGAEDSRVEVVDNEQGTRWRAEAGQIINREPVETQVDSLTIDGETASGTATFVDIAAILNGEEPQQVTGSFEINCSEG